MFLLTENINELYGATFPVLSLSGWPQSRVLGWFLPGAETLKENSVGGELRTRLIARHLTLLLGGSVWGELFMISSFIGSHPPGVLWLPPAEQF
jgi:hypothetical protein